MGSEWVANLGGRGSDGMEGANLGWLEDDNNGSQAHDKRWRLWMTCASEMGIRVLLLTLEQQKETPFLADCRERLRETSEHPPNVRGRKGTQIHEQVGEEKTGNPPSRE